MAGLETIRWAAPPQTRQTSSGASLMRWMASNTWSQSSQRYS